MVIIAQPQKNHRDTVVPRSYATPSYAIFKGPKKLKLSYFPPSYTIFPPCYAIFFFFPPLRSLLCFRRKNSVTGGKNTNTSLQHKTNPELRYFGSYTIFK